jgi:hypothetical protein
MRVVAASWGRDWRPAGGGSRRARPPRSRGHRLDRGPGLSGRPRRPDRGRDPPCADPRRRGRARRSTRCPSRAGGPAVCVTPSHQYPLGVTMSLNRRLALLEWASASGAWILEDDYDSEYRYAGRPLRGTPGARHRGPRHLRGDVQQGALPRAPARLPGRAAGAGRPLRRRARPDRPALAIGPPGGARRLHRGRAFRPSRPTDSRALRRASGRARASHAANARGGCWRWRPPRLACTWWAGCPTAWTTAWPLEPVSSTRWRRHPSRRVASDPLSEESGAADPRLCRLRAAGDRRRVHAPGGGSTRNA